MHVQAADINALFGFRLECIERMGDQQGLWAWQRLNSLFNWLPLAALIEDRIICMHGGVHMLLILYFDFVHIMPCMILICKVSSYHCPVCHAVLEPLSSSFVKGASYHAKHSRRQSNAQLYGLPSQQQQGQHSVS